MMSNKDSFKYWVSENLAKNSNAGSSYITSLEWLSKRFFEKGRISAQSVFEIEDIDLIEELYSEVKKIQKDKSSYIYNKNAPSYGDKHYFSASLKKYKEFLLAE